MPGAYTVALVVDGKVTDSKPLRIVMDPHVQFSDAARAKYNTVVTELHTLQGQGSDAAAQLTALYAEMQKVVPKVDSSSAPENVKTQFSTFRKDFDAVRAKFGVGVPAVGFAGFGGGGGGGAVPGGGTNVFGRVGAVKGAVMSAWETPSDAVMKQVAEVKRALPAAIAEANTVMAEARDMSRTLSSHSVTLTVPK